LIIISNRAEQALRQVVAQRAPGTLDVRPKYQMADGKSIRAATLHEFSVNLHLEPGGRIRTEIESARKKKFET
jgi:hypothetical protein